MTRRKMIKAFEDENWVILVDKNNPKGWAEAKWKHKDRSPDMDKILSSENVQRAFDEIGFSYESKEKDK